MPMLGSPAPVNPVRTSVAVAPLRAVATGVPTATANAAAAATRTQEERLIPVTSTAAKTSLPRSEDGDREVPRVPHRLGPDLGEFGERAVQQPGRDPELLGDCR